MKNNQSGKAKAKGDGHSRWHPWRNDAPIDWPWFIWRLYGLDCVACGDRHHSAAGWARCRWPYDRALISLLAWDPVVRGGLWVLELTLLAYLLAILAA